MSDLLEDLIEEILSRVLVTSLKRLRSTCKIWNALFNDNRFTKKHSDKAAKEFFLIMFADGGSYLTNVNLRGIPNNIDPTLKVTRKVFGYTHHEYIHCNGLLLYTMYTNACGITVVVRNPCTEQTRWIKLRTNYRTLDIFALGYKNNKSSCCINSYKILRCSGGDIINVFEIYEFNSNSWRIIDDITCDWEIVVDDRGVSLMGNTYWIALDSKAPVHIDGFLLKFDFTKEKFQCLGLPFKCNCYYDTVVLSTVREEKLAVLFQKEKEPMMAIWLTNNKIDNYVVWSMLFKVDLDKEYMFSSSMSFMVDEVSKVAVCCNTLSEEDRDITRIHIVGEDQFREVDHLGDFAFDQPFTSQYKDVPFLFSYAPSLVQI